MALTAIMQLRDIMASIDVDLYTGKMGSTSTANTLRERQRDRTREDIQTAAFMLFGESGFEGTTVAAISARAGVAIRTFFRYFPTKEDVVFGDHDGMVARLSAALESADPDDPPIWRVRQAVLAVQQPGHNRAREITRARLIAEVPSVRARSYQLAEAFEEVVAADLAKDLGSDIDGVAPAMIIAGAVFGALRGARRAASTMQHPDPLWLIETAFAVAERGSATYLTQGGHPASERASGPDPDAPDVSSP